MGPIQKLVKEAFERNFKYGLSQYNRVEVTSVVKSKLMEIVEIQKMDKEYWWNRNKETINKVIDLCDEILLETPIDSKYVYKEIPQLIFKSNLFHYDVIDSGNENSTLDDFCAEANRGVFNSTGRYIPYKESMPWSLIFSFANGGIKDKNEDWLANEVVKHINSKLDKVALLSIRRHKLKCIGIKVVIEE